jgi:PKD repeat protein
VVQFRASGEDPEGKPVTYHWDFGDGATSEVQNPLHTYAQPETYDVILTVSDGELKASKSIKVLVGEAILRQREAQRLIEQRTFATFGWLVLLKELDGQFTLGRTISVEAFVAFATNDVNRTMGHVVKHVVRPAMSTLERTRRESHPMEHLQPYLFEGVIRQAIFYCDPATIDVDTLPGLSCLLGDPYNPPSDRLIVRAMKLLGITEYIRISSSRFMMDVVQHVAAALIRVIEGDESLCKELTEAGIEVDCTLFHELRESKAGSPRQPGP